MPKAGGLLLILVKGQGSQSASIGCRKNQIFLDGNFEKVRGNNAVSSKKKLNEKGEN